MEALSRMIAMALVVAFVLIGCAEQAAEQDPLIPEGEEAQPAPLDALADGRQGLQYAEKRQAAEPDATNGYVPPEDSDEAYARIEENPFKMTEDHPLSTFSIDVDAASYSNIRRILRQGWAPPKDAVRIEEMVNYFVYDYPEPDEEHPFSITAEVGPAPWNPAHRLVHLGLQGRRMHSDEQPDNNLVFLLDVSGSMEADDKLPLLKKAFGMLVEAMTERDRVAIVVYAGAAGLVLPSTPGDRKETILKALDRLEAGGSTAGAAGIQLAYEVALEHFIEGGNNRVILATDGDFNVGPSGDDALITLIESMRDRGTFLTVLGFGTGNLKDAKMEQIADHGNGNYYYIDGELEARKVLVTDLRGTLFTIAKDVKIQVEFNPAVVAAYRLIGYENRLLADEDFEDDTKDAGELGAGHTVTALYEVIPVGVPTDTAVRDRGDLKYQQNALTTQAVASGEMMTVKLRYKAPDGDASRLTERVVMQAASDETPGNNFYFSAAVAEFGMLLRDSEHKGGATLEQVLGLARDALGEDREGYRAEFIGLVEDYQAILGDGSVSEVRR